LIKRVSPKEKKSTNDILKKKVLVINYAELRKNKNLKKKKKNKIK